MKRILSLIFAICMIVSCVFVLTACDKEDNGRVVNLSLNPSIEFVLDSDEKVVTVSAINDEGNFILTKAVFVGLSVKDAVELFIKTTIDNGFVVQGDVSVGENQFNISISGENANKLYKNLKESAQSLLNKLYISAEISFEELDRDYLETLVADCMRELDLKDIEKMKENKLLDLIEQSRNQTKDLYSQELKEMFYQTRVEEILKAKFEKVKTLLASTKNPEFKAFETQFTTAFQSFTQYFNQFKVKYQEQFLSLNSDYYQEMENFIEQKKQLLRARIDKKTGTEIAKLKLKVLEQEKLLADTKSVAELTVSQIKTNINYSVQTLDNIIDLMSAFIKKVDFDSILEEAETTAMTKFKANYNTYIINNYWTNLAPKAA